MKYFIIEQKEKLPNVPVIQNWYKKINVEAITKAECWKIPKRTALDVMPDKYITFYDVLSFPFFMVSETVCDIIKSFEPNLIVKDIVLFDSRYRTAEKYCLPILDEMIDLSDENLLCIHNKKYSDVMLDLNGMSDKYIFQVTSYDKKYVIMRLELVETILRRDVKGIMLHEIKVNRDGYIQK